MNAPLYTTEILRLAASLEDPHALERVDGRARRRSPTCGSRVATEVQLDPAGRVAALSQQVEACAFGQAAAALVGRFAAGRSGAEVEQAVSELADWLLEGSTKSVSWPGVDVLARAQARPSRHRAILLPFEALAAAIEDASK